MAELGRLPDLGQNKLAQEPGGLDHAKLFAQAVNLGAVSGEDIGGVGAAGVLAK